ncbi:inactive ubiquitin carboxyl-terminal hydrolase MINDY-4B isoform X2 [Athene noctua]|uniref:inactive ubiquitin carboxyl-terminal hydrolase MINDY-4B isoform X2 n=1 Tax=Athene noctua TaxID=126797 RepID=UPI003EBE9E4D
MAVQAHVIAYLLFVRNTRHTHLERLRRVSGQEQGEALAAALADTLWAAAAAGGGGGRRVVVCLLAAAAHIVPRGDYEADSFTERIQLFEFSEKAAAQEFIFDHINCGPRRFRLHSNPSVRVQFWKHHLYTGRAQPPPHGPSGPARARRQPGAGFQQRRWRCLEAAGPSGLPVLWRRASGVAGEPRAEDAPAARLAVRPGRQARRPLWHRQPAPLRLEKGESLPPALLQRAGESSPPNDRHSFASLGRGPQRGPKQPREQAPACGDGDQEQVGRRQRQLERDRALLLKPGLPLAADSTKLPSGGEKTLSPIKQPRGPRADAVRGGVAPTGKARAGGERVAATLPERAALPGGGMHVSSLPGTKRKEGGSLLPSHARQRLRNPGVSSECSASEINTER